MMYLESDCIEKDIASQFHDLAVAYLESAERLCREMVDGTWSPSFNNGQGCLWLAFHATELFLKGCIRSVSPERLRNIHSLGEIQVTFSSLFPTVKFESPFGPEPISPQPVLMDLALKADATLHHQLRYPVDTSGTPWGGIRVFVPELFLAEIERLRSDFDRVSSIVRSKSDG